MIKKNKKNTGSNQRIASLKVQDREYNDLYRKWQIEHKNDYGFYVDGDSDELTYHGSEGFITEYPESSELNAAYETHSVIAVTLIIYTLLNLAVFALFPFLSNQLGLKVSLHSAGYFTGNETEALILSYIVNIAIRVIPQFYLMSKIKMPIKVMIPMKIANKPLFREAVPMAMFVFGINSVFSGLMMPLFGVMGIETANRIWLPESKTAMFFSSILFTIIIPVLSEVVHRGVFLQILRQFGDGYALIITSSICALVTGKADRYFFNFIFSIIIGYFVLRTGSVLTAIVMRIVISTSSYWITYLKRPDLPYDICITLSAAIITVYLIVGIVFAVSFMKKYSNKINLPMYKMYLSQRERVLSCLTNPLVIMWASFVIVHSLINLEYM